ncbi:MAG: histidine phosphatase family protein [Bradyrhizobiaceae bacterium]|nr:histidine phosphatase family protein [Bradyrhizobiaceae bacterium]
MVRCAAIALAFLLGFLAGARADDAGIAALKAGGHVMMIRHGLTTPGTGDPLGFKLGDCATQRNLIDEGREESRRLGRVLRENGIAVARVLSSEWCRCIETAELIGAGKVEKHSALNNLFGRPENRAAQVEKLRKLIAGWKGGGNLLLVTHGATMGALMGINPETAAGVVLAPAPETKDGFRVVGRIGPRG